MDFTGNDACVCMHTALRKCCDSKITSAAYNLIHLLCKQGPKNSDQNPWNMFGTATAKHMADGMEPLDAAKRAAEELDDRYTDVVMELRKSGEKEPESFITWIYALQCTLLCFDKSDWNGFVAYLEE